MTVCPFTFRWVILFLRSGTCGDRRWAGIKPSIQTPQSNSDIGWCCLYFDLQVVISPLMWDARQFPECLGFFVRIYCYVGLEISCLDIICLAFFHKLMWETCFWMTIFEKQMYLLHRYISFVLFLSTKLKKKKKWFFSTHFKGNISSYLIQNFFLLQNLQFYFYFCFYFLLIF